MKPQWVFRAFELSHAGRPPAGCPETLSEDVLRFRRFHWRLWIGPLVIALVVWMRIITAIDPAGDYPASEQGPGLTVDEGYNVEHGLQLVDRLLDLDPKGFRAACALLPDHPPLGRIWIGAWHEATYLVQPPIDPQAGYSIACGRMGSATAFAILLFLIGTMTARWYGTVAGTAAAAIPYLMPRVFGHAHLAALETCTSLACATVVLFLADRWTGREPPTWKSAYMGGLLFGLALLTKVQAVLLPIPIAICMLIAWRKKAIVPLLIWGVVGGLVFLVGWPWLWDDPIGKTLGYLGRTTNRMTIHAWYFGQDYADKELPWHYPWVLFLLTVPVLLHVSGFYGAATTCRKQGSLREWLLLSTALFPLVVFSVPGVTVYDGERLFLNSFPLWAIFVGIGISRCFDWLALRWGKRRAAIVMCLLLSTQGWGLLTMSPCELSYYNLAAGGLRGANAMGLEPTYWGDSITRDFLQEVVKAVPRGSVIEVTPTVDPFYLKELMSQSPVLRDADIHLLPYEAESSKADFTLFYTRWEYLPKSWKEQGLPQDLLVSVRKEGVVLAGLCKRR